MWFLNLKISCLAIFALSTSLLNFTLEHPPKMWHKGRAFCFSTRNPSFYPCSLSKAWEEQLLHVSKANTFKFVMKME